MLKIKESFDIGILNVSTTFNNTIITLSDIKGNTLFWSSCGKMNFKGSKKNTYFATKIVAEEIIKKCIHFDIKKIKIIIKGYGNGRDSAIKVASDLGIKIISIEDKTPTAHNGCRPPKKRRL